MLSAFEHELGVVERRGPDDAEVRSATGDSRQVVIYLKEQEQLENLP